MHTCGLLATIASYAGAPIPWKIGNLPYFYTFSQLSTFGDLVCGLRLFSKSIECFGVLPPGSLSHHHQGRFDPWRWGSGMPAGCATTGTLCLVARDRDPRWNVGGMIVSGRQPIPKVRSFVSQWRHHTCAIDEKFALVCWGQQEPVVGMDDARSSEARRTTGVSENLYL